MASNAVKYLPSLSRNQFSKFLFETCTTLIGNNINPLIASPIANDKICKSDMLCNDRTLVRNNKIVTLSTEATTLFIPNIITKKVRAFAGTWDKVDKQDETSYVVIFFIILLVMYFVSKSD